MFPKKQMESQPLHKVVAPVLKDKQLPGSLWTTFKINDKYFLSVAYWSNLFIFFGGYKSMNMTRVDYLFVKESTMFNNH